MEQAAVSQFPIGPMASKRPSSGIEDQSPDRPPHLQVLNLSKRFGELLALDSVNLEVAPGTFHALLGENGAGKSTLVKCIMGYHEPSGGQILLSGKEKRIASPRDAQDLGIGMVYQHFTLVPSMSVEENLLLSRSHLPNFIDWLSERQKLDAFLETMPFKTDRSARISTLAAGEKQKIEIIKQLYLGSRIVFLDEPTSVLTPDEADQVLGTLRKMVDDGLISVLLISHKMREVTQFAQSVTILRHGRVVGGGTVGQLTTRMMTELMVGSHEFPAPAERKTRQLGEVKLSLNDLCAANDKGTQAVKSLSLEIRSGEIYGVAGVSGNGQKELVEVLSGQRMAESGSVKVNGEQYIAKRKEMSRHHFYCLPEEPLRNAAVGTMSVEENLALRNFDRRENRWLGVFISRSKLRSTALAAINHFKIKTSGPSMPAAELSGGNLQRLVLARDLSDSVQVFVVSNPCFGLDVKATAEVRRRIVEARNAGAAVLLLSEDLDEIFELADRIGVISLGTIVVEHAVGSASRTEIGHAMTGHLH